MNWIDAFVNVILVGLVLSHCKERETRIFIGILSILLSAFYWCLKLQLV